MANTFFGLTVAASGLNASNIAINTTAHNVANINTKGYSKQVATAETAPSIQAFSSFGTIGTGVNVTSIDQLRSSYYDTKYWNNNSYAGQYKSLESYSTLIEDYLDEFNLKGFTTEYENIFTAINSLINNDPSNEVARNQLINYSSSLTKYFNTLSQNLSNVQKSANEEVRTTVNAINTVAEKVSQLNTQINTIEINGGSANDLRDARALLIDELSGYIDVKVTETKYDTGGSYYNVSINNQVLVDGSNYNALNCEARDVDEKRNASDIEGLYNITWNNGLYLNLYGTSITGSLRAAVDVRDGCSNGYEVMGLQNAAGEFLKSGGKVVDVQDLSDSEYATYLAAGYSKKLTLVADSYHNSEYKGIPYYQQQLNQFAQTFADSFNKIITAGDLNGATVPDFFVSKYGDSFISAGNMAVNQSIIDDNKLLPYSYNNSIGSANTDMVNDLAAIRNKKTIKNGTFEEYLKSIVSVISVDTGNAKSFAKNYANVQATIQNQRLSVCGVDEDEEGVDLVRFQNAYNLASKMISVMQEIYDKLIEQTGL